MSEINIIGSRQREYKDLSLSFAQNPVTNDVLAVTGADAVKRAIKTLLMTDVTEIPFFPNFGSRLNFLMFEPIDPMTTSAIADEIRVTIEGFEPRARIQTLRVIPSEDEHRYQIDILFEILTLSEPVTLTLFLSRLR